MTQRARPLRSPAMFHVYMVDEQQVRLLRAPPPTRQSPLVPEHLCVTAMPRTCPTGRRVGALASPKALWSLSISARTAPPCARPTTPERPATPPRPANGRIPSDSFRSGGCLLRRSRTASCAMATAWPRGASSCSSPRWSWRMIKGVIDAYASSCARWYAARAQKRPQSHAVAASVCG